MAFGEVPAAGVFWGGALILGAIAATTVHARSQPPAA
jgi:hypothetical protein